MTLKTTSETSTPISTGAASVLPKRLNSALLATLKWALALGFLYYAFQTGLIRTASESLFNVRLFSIALLFQFLIVFVQAARWKSINDYNGLKLTLFETFRIGMISHFFALFAGGSMGSDVVRGIYATKASTKKPWETALTLVFDRGVGLVLTLVGAFVGLAWKAGSIPEGTALGKAAGLALASSSYFAVLLVTGGAVAVYFLGFQVIRVLFYSLISMSAAVCWAYVVGIWTSVPLSFQDFLFIVPIVTIVSAIPALPLGIGVGQLAYFHLFQMFGVSGELGASLCTLLQAQAIGFNLLGAFFYLGHRHPSPSLSQKNA